MTISCPTADRPPPLRRRRYVVPDRGVSRRHIFLFEARDIAHDLSPEIAGGAATGGDELVTFDMGPGHFSSERRIPKP